MGEAPRIAVLVPNLFLRVSIDAAVRGAGAEPVTVAGPEQELRDVARVVIVDLDTIAPDPAPAVRAWVQRGVVVLGFGPHVEAARLAAARHAGAVVLPRSTFLGRLPELLRAALASAGVATPRRGGDGDDEGGHGS